MSVRLERIEEYVCDLKYLGQIRKGENSKSKFLLVWQTQEQIILQVAFIMRLGEQNKLKNMSNNDNDKFNLILEYIFHI